MSWLPANVKRWLKRRLDIPTIEFALERLAGLGFAPRLIFDVGAYQGDFTQICRSVWSDARIGCFEVQLEPLTRLTAAFSHDRNVQVWQYLLGAAASERVQLHLSDTGSSILEDSTYKNVPTAHFPMRTVDEVIQREYAGQAPELLKADVQGYELEVLRGSEQFLDRIEVILLEVNLIDIYKNVPLIGDIFDWLGGRDWVAYDICGLTRRPLDGALWQVDVIFVKKTSGLRASKRWTR